MFSWKKKSAERKDSVEEEAEGEEGRTDYSINQEPQVRGGVTSQLDSQAGPVE